MFEFHLEKEKYFLQQQENATAYVIPFIEEVIKITPNMQVLEVGCAEAGVLKEFINRGCIGTGVELSESRANQAKQFLRYEIENKKASIISQNIYDDEFIQKFRGVFDLIILKDVIEHIHDQQKIISQLRQYLKPGGKIFFGFPPWYMPFGGHQQVCRNKLLSKLPYYHLFPNIIYKWLLNLGGEDKILIKDLLEVKETGISIERFEKCVHQAGLEIQARKYYLINPIYRYKFGWQPREQNIIIRNIPFVRNFFTTCMYYVVG